MRRTHPAWLPSGAFLVVLGAALAGALPAVAGTVSFSVNMAGEEVILQEGNLSVLRMMPFNGTMQPFGKCRSEGTVPGSDASTMVFTLANGMTITAPVAFLYEPSSDTVAVNGTITGGTGIFEDASGTITGTIAANKAAATATVLPLTFTASGTLTAPKAPSGLSVLPSVLTFNIPNGSTAPVTESLVVNNGGLDTQSCQVSLTTAAGGSWLTASPGSGSVAGSPWPSLMV